MIRRALCGLSPTSSSVCCDCYRESHTSFQFLTLLNTSCFPQQLHETWPQMLIFFDFPNHPIDSPVTVQWTERETRVWTKAQHFFFFAPGFVLYWWEGERVTGMGEWDHRKIIFAATPGMVTGDTSATSSFLLMLPFSPPIHALRQDLLSAIMRCCWQDFCHKVLLFFSFLFFF